jgi:hypothetical protein
LCRLPPCKEIRPPRLDGRSISLDQSYPGAHDDRPGGKLCVAIPELKGAWRQLNDLPRGQETVHSNNDICDLPTVSPGVHPHGSTDRCRNTPRKFESRESSAAEIPRQGHERYRATDLEFIRTESAHSPKSPAQADDAAERKPAVTDQDITPGP